MTKRRKIEISVTKQTRPTGQLLHAAKSLREIAASGTAGSYWAGMGGLVLLAFAVEAFCQEHGPALFPETWTGKGGVERKPVKDKLKSIGALAGVPVHFGKQPWSDVAALLKVRDSIAHAKPAELIHTLSLHLSDEEEAALHRREFPVEPWELMAAPGTAEAVAESVYAALRSLLVGLGKNVWELERLGSGSYIYSEAR